MTFNYQFEQRKTQLKNKKAILLKTYLNNTTHLEGTNVCLNPILHDICHFSNARSNIKFFSHLLQSDFTLFPFFFFLAKAQRHDDLPKRQLSQQILMSHRAIVERHPRVSMAHKTSGFEGHVDPMGSTKETHRNTWAYDNGGLIKNPLQDSIVAPHNGEPHLP